MTILHVFDMDGTLLRSTAAAELSRCVGRLDEARDIERGWLDGEITDEGFWEQCLPLWADLTEALVDAAFAEAPWINGVVEVFRDIKDRGEYIAVISQSPAFFVRRLRRWGADATFGASVEPGGRTGPDVLLTKEDKVTITRQLLMQYGLETGCCVAYGDSSSDELLFDFLSNTVAVNGSPTVRSLAALSYEGDDLRNVYALGRKLVDKGAAT